MKWWQNKYNITLIAILVIAFLLRWWNIPGSDIQNDAALNTLRSFGWFDFLTGEDQTSPIVWFGSIPWWGHLSFHDMPPLVQSIQFVFLNLFGSGSLSVLLPFILSGLVVTYLLYYLMSKVANRQKALLTAGLFSITSYAVWASRTGYLEGVAVVFIVLSVIAWLFFLKSSKNKYLYYWALVTGLALLSKYTALFLLLAVGLYIIIWRRDVLKNKHFWLSIIVMLLVLTPVIIYNIMVFKTRGHFDAALSSMLGMHPEDFAAIASRGANTNFLQNIGTIIIVLYKSSSLALFILYILSLFFVLIKVIKRQAGFVINFLFINILAIFLLFTFSGAPPRFLSIIVPFFSIITVLFIFQIWQWLNNKKIWKKSFIILLILVFVFEIFYSINTNIIKNPKGPEFVTYSGYRFYDRGFEELDNYLQDEIIKDDLPTRIRTEKYNDMAEIKATVDWVVLFDERADWFSQAWYINKYLIYYRLPIFPIKYVNQVDMQGQSILEYFRNIGTKEVYFIYTTPAGDRSGQSQRYIDQMENLREYLDASAITPTKEIKDYKGDVVFKIYHFYFNE
jgi:4-amino-4-deoxy-L-arabinose transferase-like glycosyltransferase